MFKCNSRFSTYNFKFLYFLSCFTALAVCGTIQELHIPIEGKRKV